MFKCKYCGKEFEKVASYAAHMSNCKLSPTLKRTYDRDTISKRVKNAAQRKREKQSL